jgi:CubicO group peptidase (beta-lactamase class C family)
MSVTTVPGLNADRLRHLVAVMEEDVEKGLYYGGVVIVGRGGEVGLHHAFGHADAGKTIRVEKGSVFSIFSVTKALTTVLALRAIELGQMAFTTPVADVVPEFGGGGREKITLYHLLTHSSGLPSVYEAKPGMYIDVLADVIAAICENVHPAIEPGVRVDYAPLVGHAMMGEMVRRLDPKGRRYRDIVQDEIFAPLGMKDSSIGVRRDLKPRHLKPDLRGAYPINHLGRSNYGPNGAFEEEDAEMPWVGCASSAESFFRFVEMLRRGGELDGARILSPTTIKRMRKNQTGDKPNELYKRLCEANGWPVLPAYMGLGLPLRGEAFGNHYYGTLTSPETFGAYGAGSTLFWVDPELDMSFLGFTTGVMASAPNYMRWRRLSDIAVSAAV